jgi:hypothetical protein
MEMEQPEGEMEQEGQSVDPKELITGVSTAMSVLAQTIDQMPDVSPDQKGAFQEVMQKYQDVVSQIFSGEPQKAQGPKPVPGNMSSIGGPKGQPVG